ncbi:MAG: N-acetyltransferase [Anaerolineaceae bacterium]|nr:N-acetyltransferase [Anaerolineaceae bacterium]
MDFRIEPMQTGDWPQVSMIYKEGIDTGNATFETTVPEWAVWDEKHRPDCRLVARHSESILGWAALTSVSSRCVYAGVAEVSVYVAAAGRGQGIGRALLERLVAESEQAGLWMLQASIFPENMTSITLHTACGFREVGRREKIGQMNGLWRDTVFMERRSRIVGV